MLAIRGVAQETDSVRAANPRFSALHLMARADRDSVVLRWAPTRPGGWVIANRLGYLVERVRMENGAPKGAFERLTPSPILPWTLAEWRKRTTPDRRFGAIAAQVLYGRVSVPKATGSEGIHALQLASEELSNRHGFALFAADNDAFAAEGLGLRYADTHVHEGEHFLYRVFVARADTSYTFDTAYVFVDVAPAVRPPAPPALTAEELDGHVVLHWNDHPASPYSAYTVARSDDDGRTWHDLTAIPFVVLTPDNAREKPTPRYDDTTVTNYRRYRYRVRGISPFAEASEPAEIAAMGRDVTPPHAPSAHNPKQVGAHSVKLEWKMRAVDGDLAGFVIARSGYANTGFAQMFEKPLPPDARSFTDTAATEDEPYYIIGAVDTAGNVARSLPVYATIIDSTPPRIPTGLTGTIDSTGVVRLHWDRNVERHVIGYRVLWANDPHHEFTQRTPYPIPDTSFVDSVSVNTLTSYVYYRVAALTDRRVYSDMSPILALRRPDRLPPEPSIITSVDVSDSAVVLHWAVSASEDLAQQVVMRRVTGERDWQKRATLDRRANAYVDRDVRRGTTYEYLLTSIDSSGLHADAPYSVQGRPYDTGVRPPATNVTARYDSVRKSVTVRWEYTPASAERLWFVIYRATGGRKVAQYRSVDANARSFEDALLVGPGQYEYAVRAMTSVAESPLSPHVRVEVR